MLDKDEEQELKAFIKERHKWKHFFEILRRWYIWVPLVTTMLYLKESPPLHIPIVDQLLQIVKAFLKL